jgi:hypothetical protein
MEPTCYFQRARLLSVSPRRIHLAKTGSRYKGWKIYDQIFVIPLYIAVL